MALDGKISLAYLPYRLASVLRGVPNILQSVVAFAGILRQGSTGTLVEVNQGLLVTGYVRFGVAPVPNLCVELRGYDTAVMADVSSPPHAGVATAPYTGGRAWRDWEKAEPRFLQLQRTAESDGSFAFVTPESGLVLVLAAYSQGGDYPTAVRVFPDELSGNGQKTAQGYDASDRDKQPAFGIDSGRVQMHIDLLWGDYDQAPEALWSPSAARENDQSPCARMEAVTNSEGDTASDSMNSGVAMEGGDVDDDAAAAAAAAAAPAPSFFARIHLTYLLTAAGDKTAPTIVALTTLLRTLRCKLSQLGPFLSAASASFHAQFLSGVETAWQHAHQRVVVESSWLPAWLSAWFTQDSTELPGWFEQASEWYWTAPIRLRSWGERQGPVELRAWWAVWWIRLGGIALCLGALQQAFVFICKYFRASVDESDDAAVGDHRGCEPRREDPPSEMAAMVGTFHSSDGTVSHLEMARFDRPKGPAVGERARRSILGAMWDNSVNRPAEMTSGGEEEDTDDFSFMFRALSQPACNVMEPAERGAGGASNVVIVTQRNWPQEAREGHDY